MNKIKAGKAPGVCSICPEYIQHGGSDALCTLHKIITRVWEEEVVPEEWHQGIIVPLNKGKGSNLGYSSYRGITLLCLLGKMFAHIILARIKPTLLSHRRPQESGFTPGRSTCDGIAILCNVAQRRQEAIQLLQHLLISVLHLMGNITFLSASLYVSKRGAY